MKVVSDSAALGTSLPIQHKIVLPPAISLTIHHFSLTWLFFSMPQDETYLNNILDLYFSVPISEISLFLIVGQFESSLENCKSVNEQLITAKQTTAVSS